MVHGGQDRSKMTQDGHKMSPDEPKMVQNEPRRKVVRKKKEKCNNEQYSMVLAWFSLSQGGGGVENQIII